MQRPYTQVDVFAGDDFAGNPLAVVLNGSGLSTAEMQRFAAWTNLSETVFVLPVTDPNASYRVRIFTQTEELPFAGHPTLGACHAWLEVGGSPAEGEFVQECEAGLVRVRAFDSRLAFAAPPLIHGGPASAEERRHVAEILRLDECQLLAVEWVDNGPGWIAALLADAAAVLALRPGPVDLDLGVVGPYPDGSPVAIEVRAFFPGRTGVVEDPVTGSLNAALAQWLLSSDRIRAPYVASQGTALGRQGRVHVSVDGSGEVWTGGVTVTRIRGHVTL